MIRQIQNNCLKTETQMPRRKKERSIYVTKEPEWNTLRLITDIKKQEEAFRSCEYFVRTEITVFSLSLYLSEEATIKLGENDILVLPRFFKTPSLLK